MVRNYIRTPLLLLDMPFYPGECLERINHIENTAARDTAMMQYYYFTCHNEQAAESAQKYLECENLKIRIIALLIYTFASMALGNKREALRGRENLKKLGAGQNEFSRESGIPLTLSAAKLVLHIPITEEERRTISEESEVCDEGSRLLCCYLLEQKSWEEKEYERIIGAVETAVHMTRNSYPLIELYFYLSASEEALHLKDITRAEMYFQKAWDLVEADGFIGPVGEMYGHLQVFLEKKVKKENPTIYKQIMQATHQYRIGWREIICGKVPAREEYQKKNLRENLTGMEYAVGYLAGQEWSNQEISDYFNISVRTVKYYMTTVLSKLNISGRREICGLLD